MNFGGTDFEVVPCCLCSNLSPNEDSYNLIKILKTNIKLNLIQDSCCFSMQDAFDKCVAIRI